MDYFQDSSKVEVLSCCTCVAALPGLFMYAGLKDSGLQTEDINKEVVHIASTR